MILFFRSLIAACSPLFKLRCLDPLTRSLHLAFYPPLHVTQNQIGYSKRKPNLIALQIRINRFTDGTLKKVREYTHATAHREIINLS